MAIEYATSSPSDLRRETWDGPETIALRYMQAGPPTDLMGLAAALGLRIEYAALGDLSGKIERRAAETFVITLNSAHGENRQRFTLAHEIAHYIRHRPQLEAGGIVDNALYRSLLPDPMEWEANRFAAQLLMPMTAMRRLWSEGYRTPAQFAPRLGVSEEAARIRLDQVQGALASGNPSIAGG